MGRQLALNIQLNDAATIASFYPGDNVEVLEAVTEIATGGEAESREPFLYLWGQEGVGKTHLLQAACHSASEKNIAAFYISFETYQKLSSSILQGVENLPLVCLDDIDKIAGQAVWEETLFHLFNQIRSQQGRLLVAADVPPKNLNIALPDLKSRLAWGIVYQLHGLTDEQKINALKLRAHQRGLELIDTVGQFLLTRCSRSMSELFDILEKLDKASLTEQRRLTIPFVKQVLEI